LGAVHVDRVEYPLQDLESDVVGDLLSASDKTVRLWDPASGKLL
jgi:hypothetical protein